jgi:YfiH family protein
MQQVHDRQIAVVEPALEGQRVDSADGLIVNRPGVPLMALSADCPLVVACDPARGVLGMAHAGWRGMLGGIVRRLIDAMVERFGCRAEAISAAISPSAGPCCYQVGDEVTRRAAETLPDSEQHLRRHDGMVFFDLWSACLAQLRSAGIRPQRIDLAARCTICDPRFFSYRRDGPTTGHAGLIATLPERA